MIKDKKEGRKGVFRHFPQHRLHVYITFFMGKGDDPHSLLT